MNGRDMVGRLAEKAKEVMGKNRLIWLIILAGVILLALPVGGKEEEAKEGCSTPAETFDLAETEARLSQALSKIKGAGEVTVVLTVEHGPRRVLAEDISRDSADGGKSTQTVVISQGSGQQEAVTVQEVSPRYQGAFLVCEGAGDPEVRLELTQAVSALTGLGADKISISKGK